MRDRAGTGDSLDIRRLTSASSLLACALLGCPAAPERSPAGDQARVAEQAQPSQPEPDPTTTPASRPEPWPTGELLLTITPDMKPQAEALAGLTVSACDEASASKPVACGLSAPCSELGVQWFGQIARSGWFASTQAEIVETLEQQDYPEPKDCADTPAPTSEDFLARAAAIHHHVPEITPNEVLGLLARTSEGWQSLARLGEALSSGETWNTEHTPVASWSLDIDGHPGEELIVLVRGQNHGPANAKDPFVRSRVVICGVHPRSPDETGPWCGRIDLERSLVPAAQASASPEQHRASWAGTLRIYQNGGLELLAPAPRRLRQFDLNGLRRADRTLMTLP